MQKILFLIPTLGHGGAERVLVNLVNHLDIHKYKITVQTIFDEGVNKQYLSSRVSYKTFLKHQFRGNSILFSLLPARLLYKWIVGEEYDVVISFLEGPSARIVSGCPFKASKKVYWIHIELGDEKKFRVGFRCFSQALETYKKANKIIFVAESVKMCFKKTAGCDFPNGIVLYNVNETEQIIKKSREPIEDVKFSSRTLNICSVAKVMHTKGFDRLAKVHNRLICEGVKHHIYVLGIGPEQKKLEAYLHEKHLEDSFSFLGYRDNPFKYIAACDLYVCSSRREGFSTAVTEALIVGTPVVSTDCSGARELLGENDEYGIVTENSEEGIYQGLRKILLDDDLRRHYTQKALERGKKFSCETSVRAVENMLDSL